MTRPVRTVLLVMALCAAPATARADGYLAPYFGSAFGGTIADLEPPGESRRPYTWGVCMGSMGGGVFGFEIDVAFTPDFYAESDDLLYGDNSVTTVMSNMIIGVPIGGQRGAGFRPYFSAGVGLIRQRIDSFNEIVEFSTDNFGYNIGGGAFIFFGANFGIRGDFRYFRNFGDEDDWVDFGGEPYTFNFTRATASFVFRF
jgi:hypothetical protein